MTVPDPLVTLIETMELRIIDLWAETAGSLGDPRTGARRAEDDGTLSEAQRAFETVRSALDDHA